MLTFFLNTGTDNGYYCLVSFHDEDSVVVAPFKKIMHVTDVQIKEGDVVNVLWNDKRQYPATLLLKGNKFVFTFKCYFIYIIYNIHR